MDWKQRDKEVDMPDYKQNGVDVCVDNIAEDMENLAELAAVAIDTEGRYRIYHSLMREGKAATMLRLAEIFNVGNFIQLADIVCHGDEGGEE